VSSGWLTAALALAMLTGSAAAVQEGTAPPQPAPPAKRPKYSLLHQNEDWSVLPLLPEGDRDFFDPIKYVRLNDDGSIWASFGGDFRMRVENWRNFNFGAAPPGVDTDDTFLLTRLLLHGDVHFGEQWRAFLELKSAFVTDRDLAGGARSIDQDQFDVQQLFVDGNFELSESSSLMLRPGRQMFAFGAQRLVSPLPWANALRAWDGLSGVLTVGAWHITGLLTDFVPVDDYGYNQPAWDQKLYGIYASGPNGLEVYWLGSEGDDAVYNGTTGDEERETLGLRASGDFAQQADYDVEVDYQFGRVGSGSVSAWSFASQIGYELVEPLRVWAGFDWASGDDKPGGDVQTFNQLYPLGHAYFGITDMIGRQNIIDTSLGAKWWAVKNVSLDLAGHSFWVDSTNDAIYSAGAAVVRPGGSFDSSWIGYELDLVGNWRIDRHFAVNAGYGHFFAGDAIEESGPSDDIDFLYAQLGFGF